MNMDSRFRKNPESVFYYLWQKELRELSSGIYNVLKSSSRKSHTVKQFVDGISGQFIGMLTYQQSNTCQEIFIVYNKLGQAP